MLLKIENLHKSIGLKELYKDLELSVDEKEKIGFIGRNGLGKTSLFKILNGTDYDYDGLVELKKDVRIVTTLQEHFFEHDLTPLEYVLHAVPGFIDLQNTIKRYESNGDGAPTLEEYLDALHEFTENGYFHIEDKICQSLIDFQLDEEQVLGSMQTLSGGEKRFVELVRVMYSEADLVLIDEPTNHMDYAGKAKFIEWLDMIDKTLIVISHDRDVLKHVSRIIELKEHKLYSFNGNYDTYIKQNSFTNISSIKKYELDLKNIAIAKKQMLLARAQKQAAKSDGARMSAKIREERFQREMDTLTHVLTKPSLWIDQNSLEDIDERVVESYDKYKEKNILIRQKSERSHKKLLLDIQKLSIGYSEPLFANINLDLFFGDRVFIKGRNGAGKSTLIKTIISLTNHHDTNATIFYGDIKVASGLRVGVYEQEVDKRFLSKTLEDAVYQLYFDHNLPINNQKLMEILKNYLFEPETDAYLTFDKLSGGQKARFQLIKMFINEPNLLILDEPTNHLDLPSIEELENTLKAFLGGILYISHDNYFVDALGGRTIEITNNTNVK